MIGKFPKNVSVNDLNGILESLPLPQENGNPGESRVSWTKDDIVKLREMKWVEHFDIDEFMDHARNLGEGWYRENRDMAAGVKKVNYIDRPM